MREMKNMTGIIKLGMSQKDIHKMIRKMKIGYFFKSLHLDVLAKMLFPALTIIIPLLMVGIVFNGWLESCLMTLIFYGTLGSFVGQIYLYKCLVDDLVKYGLKKEEIENAFKNGSQKEFNQLEKLIANAIEERRKEELAEAEKVEKRKRIDAIRDEGEAIACEQVRVLISPILDLIREAKELADKIQNTRTDLDNPNRVEEVDNYEKRMKAIAKEIEDFIKKMNSDYHGCGPKDLGSIEYWRRYTFWRLVFNGNILYNSLQAIAHEIGWGTINQPHLGTMLFYPKGETILHEILHFIGLEDPYLSEEDYEYLMIQRHREKYLYMERKDQEY